MVLTAVGLACLVVSIGGGFDANEASADETDAMLFSYSLVGSARGAHFGYEDPSQAAQIEGDVPEASSSLVTGGLGYGLASIAWPGATFANGGTLLQTVVPGFPPEAGTLLNYPVRAEARTGQEPPSVSNDSVPGVTMRATATPDRVDVAANLSRVEGAAGATLGSVRAVTSLKLERLLGTSSAEITATDIDIAGVVKIGSIHSVSMGTTDGLMAKGDAHTTVSGVTVAGVPATIDENGLTIGDSANPINSAINEVAKAILEQSGITLVVSSATKDVEGPTGRFTAGSVLITMPGDGAAVGRLSIGGASTVVTASRSDPSGLVPDDVVELPTGSIDDTAGTDGGEPTTLHPVTDAEVPAPLASDGDPEVTLGPAAPTLAASVGYGGLSPALIVLGMFGSVLVALGIRRFTDTLISVADSGPPCPLVD